MDFRSRRPLSLFWEALSTVECPLSPTRSMLSQADQQQLANCLGTAPLPAPCIDSLESLYWERKGQIAIGSDSVRDAVKGARGRVRETQACFFRKGVEYKSTPRSGARFAGFCLHRFDRATGIGRDGDLHGPATVQLLGPPRPHHR